VNTLPQLKDEQERIHALASQLGIAARGSRQTFRFEPKTPNFRPGAD